MEEADRMEEDGMEKQASLPNEEWFDQDTVQGAYQGSVSNSESESSGRSSGEGKSLDASISVSTRTYT
jgi:hypothetical protein